MSIAPAVVRNQLTISGGLTLGYREWGRPDGPVAVLLHGLDGAADDWALIGPGLGRRFRVIALDARGHGQSDWADSYELTDFRDDVLKMMDALGVVAGAVVGHSLGAATGYLLAATHPDRVRALVLEDMPTVPASPPAEIPDGPEPGQVTDWAAVAAVRSWRNAADPAWWEYASRIGTKTLVVGGTRSHLPQDRLAELAALIPRGSFTSLDTDHWVHAERPGEFLAVVQPFLDGAIR